MKKGILLLLIAILPLKAQDGNTDFPTPPPPPPPPDSQWQNWVFAATALVTAATGVYVVSLNRGHKAPN